jgi:hypothetical protein
MSAARFKIKQASFASIFPSVAGSAVGGFAGYGLGQRFGIKPELGALLGTLTLGTTGKLIGEKVQQAEEAEKAQTAIPAGAPYALDATSEDIPPWALQGAHLLQPSFKLGAHEHEPMSDVLFGEVPGAPVVTEGLKHGPMGALRAFAGLAGGGMGGGLLGLGLGHGAERLFRRNIRVPGIDMSLPDLLGSIGGAIGATKGLRYMRPS